MTDGFLIALTPSHLEAGDLRPLFVQQHVSHHRGGFHCRGAHFKVAILVDEEDLVERYRLACLHIQAFDLELVTGFHSVLLATCL